MDHNNAALYAYLNDTLSRWYFPLLSQKIKILDFGCGDGFLTHCIQNSFYNAEVIGFDIDVQQIEENKKQYPTIDFQSDESVIFAYERSIDLIYAVNVFHHIASKNRQGLIKKLLDIIKPSGSIIIFETNPYNLRSRSVFYKEHSQEISMLASGVLKAEVNNNYCSVATQYLYPSISHKLEPLLKYLPFGSLYALIIQKKELDTY